MLASGAAPAGLALNIYAFERVTCGGWWNYKKVISPFTRLFHTVRGEAFVSHSGSRFRLSGGTLLITPPFTPVDYFCPESFENHYVIFTAPVKGGAELFSMFEPGPPVPAGDDAAALCRRLEELNRGRGLRQYDPESPGYNSGILTGADISTPPEDALESDGTLRILISKVLRSSRLKPAWSGDDGARLAKVLSHIDTGLGNPLPLEELAGIAGLHPVYFSDYFRRVLGVRPLRYVILRRIERARLLLLGSGMSVKSIAAGCGFQDTDYFFRAFKRETGMTPGEYRASRHF